jgi:GNAT superfamily N-acetyltransferase
MIVDLPLVQRVEWSAARQGVLQSRALAGGRVLEIDGGALIAMGPGRYVNRGLGIGLGGTDAADLLDAAETFFAVDGLPSMLEVNPFVPTALVDEMRARSYTVQWFRNVYARPLHDLPPLAHDVAIEPVDDERMDAWRAILGSQAPPGSVERAVSDEFCDAMHLVPSTVDLVALVDDQPIACGSITVIDGIGWLGGAATLPAHRGRGAQQSLLIDRLHRAHRAGCDLAAATALPGGSSARNLTRVGFDLLHTQAVMARIT